MSEFVLTHTVTMATMVVLSRASERLDLETFSIGKVWFFYLNFSSYYNTNLEFTTVRLLGLFAFGLPPTCSN